MGIIEIVPKPQHILDMHTFDSCYLAQTMSNITLVCVRMRRDRMDSVLWIASQSVTHMAQGC